jgi:hypothetical protein
MVCGSRSLYHWLSFVSETTDGLILLIAPQPRLTLAATLVSHLRFILAGLFVIRRSYSGEAHLAFPPLLIFNSKYAYESHVFRTLHNFGGANFNDLNKWQS